LALAFSLSYLVVSVVAPCSRGEKDCPRPGSSRLLLGLNAVPAAAGQGIRVPPLSVLKGKGHPDRAARAGFGGSGERGKRVATRFEPEGSGNSGRGDENGKSPVDVGIIGGGIGGLATAIALRKICGISPVIYEKRDRYADFGKGTGICLSPHGLDALYNIDKECYEKAILSGNEAKGVIYDIYGKLKPDLEASTYKEKWGHPLLLISWSVIHEILMNKALDLDIPIKFGYRLNKVVSDGEGGEKVRVKFDHQESSSMREAEHDVLIAADGINSMVRKDLFGLDGLKLQGRWLVRAVLPAEKRFVDVVGDSSKLTIRDEKRASLFHNLGEKWLTWIVYTKFPPEADIYIPRDGAEARDVLLGKDFAKYPEVQQLARETPPEEIFVSNLKQLEPMLEDWRKGSVMLTGDAAHAMTPTLGQGANMALEDALQMAVSMEGCSTASDALEHFQTVRKPRVRKVFEYNLQYAKDANKEEEGDKKKTFLDMNEVTNFLFGNKGAVKPQVEAKTSTK